MAGVWLIVNSKKKKVLTAKKCLAVAHKRTHIDLVTDNTTHTMNNTTKRKRHAIQVRHYADGKTHHTSEKFTVVETVNRALRSESIGNFCPVFATYKGKARIVHSDAGDLSDPFRAESSYLKTLFIEV